MFPSLSELKRDPTLIGDALDAIQTAGDNREPLAQYLSVIVEFLYNGQGTAPATSGISEAPVNGRSYVRQNAGWSVMAGPWQLCTHPAGCSGPLYARSVGDPQLGIIEVVGQASSVSTWDGSYSFILAYLPAGLAPSGDRFALVPSSNQPATPDSLSCAWVKATGEMAIAFIFEKGQNPSIAWFNRVAIQA